MGFEDFPKTKPEIKKEAPEYESDEKVLNPEEIEKLGNEMEDYTIQLKAIIEEKKAELEVKKGKKCATLEAEIKELQTEYDGLKEMADDIESRNFEEITEKPHK